MSQARKRQDTVKVSRSAIRRSVASSTAIETGQSIPVLELKLKRKKKSRQVTLAPAKAG
jgi:hypothetical protein